MASPYYQFAGMRQRSPGIDWNAGAGGVLMASRGGTELGSNEIPNLIEMTLGPVDTFHTTAFRRTAVHQRFPRHEALFGQVMQEMGDWPLVYPKGPEAADPNQDSMSPYLYRDWSNRVPPNPASLAGVLDLSDNEKLLALAGAAALAWWLLNKKRKNPARRNSTRAPYAVYANIGSKRGLSYTMSFASKSSADAYAKTLRRDGYRARVRAQ